MSDDSDSKSLEDVLRDIERKLSSSAALNGGFDKLMMKVEDIEFTQVEVAKKIDELYDAVYDPDTGLYARIKDLEHQKQLDVKTIDTRLNEISLIEEFEEKKRVERDEIDKINKELLKKSVEQIEDLVRWKDTIMSLLKWVMGSGIVGAFGRLVYNVLSVH